MNITHSGVETVSLSSLTPHSENPRRGNVERIAESLERFGQMKPIVVQPDGTIIAGNHTFAAAKSLGWDSIAIVRVDVSDDEALAFLIADNRATDGAGWDDQGLLTALEKLQDRGLLDGIGFTQDDVDDLTNAIEGVQMTPIEPTTATHAEPPDQTAARWEGRNEGARREVVFLLLEEDFNDFRAKVDELKTAWEMSSMADTIYECVKHVHASQISQGTGSV